MNEKPAGGITTGNAALLAALVPVAGLVLGGMELARGRGSQGALLLLIGAASLVAWFLVLG